MPKVARKSTSWARRTSQSGARQPGATTTMIPATTTGSIGSILIVALHDI